MSESSETNAEPAIVWAFMRAKPAEQHRLLDWSRTLTAIRTSDRNVREKLAEIVVMTRQRKVTWPLLKLLGRAFRHLVWHARSWTFRLCVGALILTFLARGNGAAALVPLVDSVALPLWILVGAAAALTGAAIDRIRARIQRRV